MKRFKGVQILLLIIGIGYLGILTHSSNPIVVTPIVQRGAHLLGIKLKTAKVTLVNGRLHLTNLILKTKAGILTCSNLELSFQLPLTLTLAIQNGTFQNEQGIYSNIYACVQKKFKSYRGSLIATHPTYGDICLHSDPFIPINQLLKQSTAEGFAPVTVRDLYVHCFKTQAFYHLSRLTLGTVTCEEISGNTHFSKPKAACTNLHIQSLQTPYGSGTQLHFRGIHTLSLNPTTRSIHGHGCLTLGDQPTDAYLYLPSYSLKKPLQIYAYLTHNTSWLKGSIQYTIPKHHWAINEVRMSIEPEYGQAILKATDKVPMQPKITGVTHGVVKGIPNHGALNLVSGPLELNCDRGNPIVLSTIHAHLNHTTRANSETQQHLSIAFTGPQIDFNVNGTCHNWNQQGHIVCQGHSPLAVTGLIEAYLPAWWGPFFRPFTFPKSAPYIDLAIKWHPNNPALQVYGYITGDDFIYQDELIKHLGITFSSRMEQCILAIHSLATHQGAGTCKIIWDYDPLLDAKDIWTFSGRGTLGAKTWHTILEDLVQINTGGILKDCQPKDVIHAQFRGRVSYVPAETDFTHIAIQSPKLTFQGLLMDALNGTMDWQPSKTQIKQLECLLFGTDPVTATIGWDEHRFAIKLSGKHIHTEPLLRHSIFQDWVKDVPENNRYTYYGLLNTTISARGQWNPVPQLTGEGSIDFRNPNLYRIHLLGPIYKLLFFDPLKSSATLQFNRLIGDFSFTETKLSSNKLRFVGTSSQLIAKGTIDIYNKQINASANLMFPPSKEIFSLNTLKFLLNPLTHSFTIKVVGPFKSPDYDLEFLSK
ncbi:MAG: AsmA-like C-terminal region-containing protein [Opitutales bacterium]|nr:AsmA-like C-terminal region-containing protein [Opitutales bacterium]